MTWMQVPIEILGMISAVLMPLWNIPLIVRIWRRKSSRDISIYWAVGVWLCVMGILPSAIISSDAIFKLFCVVNFILFSLVAMVVLKFRKK